MLSISQNTVLKYNFAAEKEQNKIFAKLKLAAYNHGTGRKNCGANIVCILLKFTGSMINFRKKTNSYHRLNFVVIFKDSKLPIFF